MGLKSKTYDEEVLKEKDIGFYWSVRIETNKEGYESLIEVNIKNVDLKAGNVLAERIEKDIGQKKKEVKIKILF